ncbi:helix-turn-helix domain-containing protein [Selenomonas ruminantium]|uniref:Helix-turn-helix domain-containing protein n=1 Tax=Selenomonas ruminantium TaxID=971 RepID=A0A1H0S3J1_SELRU|nr:helix-turn-helix transcriptional regulator [Selenomonas ruminantium]SDP36280.1 Helix-turn-helix domain-containing protein [Selenomonas ruminantium]
MSVNVIQGSNSLAQKIRQRRAELGLTIEEAASRAGVGTKTWSRYESGESIRQDKVKGICKALNWHQWEGLDEKTSTAFSIDFYKAHEEWSEYLEKRFGTIAALSFVIGSDILHDYITDDMAELARMPKGSHIGQLDCSFLSNILPPQFLMYYNYDFLYHLLTELQRLIACAQAGREIIAHSVLDELILYLCNEEAQILIEAEKGSLELKRKEWAKYSKDWIFDLFDDMDIITFLYSDIYLDSKNPYHFSHWGDVQFYTNNL